MPLTLSVVSHGHGPYLDRLLRELDAAPTLAGAHVIVTLNLRDEPFDAAAYTSLRLEVIRNPNPKGFGANHNAAFASCRTAAFAIVNPDIALAGSEPFTAMAARLEADDAIGLTAPRVLAPNGAPEDSVRANLTPWSLLARHLFGRRLPLAPRAPTHRGSAFYWCAGMALVVNARAFEKIGGFDERYFLYCEDYDLCARLHAAGWSIVFDRGVAVIHDARRDSHASLRHLRWHLESLWRVWTSQAFWRVTLRG